MTVQSPASRKVLEEEMAFEERLSDKTLYKRLVRTATDFPDRPALTFQLKSGPKDPAETFTWKELRSRVTQSSNAFRNLGIKEDDVIAYILPNCNEAVLTLLGGATAGIVNPINPLLEPEQIGGILRETGAKVVVTLKSFPKSDVAQKVAESLTHAPDVHTVLEVDLKRYLAPPLSWLVSLLRPKNPVEHSAKVLDFNAVLDAAPSDDLTFEEPEGNRFASYFHTGGTTGLPKVAQHNHIGMLYQGWVASAVIFTEEDVMICPLPMFHVYAAYPILMAGLYSGAHIVMPTPQGYRGDGVFDNFWKLLERWQVTFMVTVPTAVSQLMQRPVDADVSSLKFALCGSSPLPVDLFKKFEKTTDVKVLEGYGLTEATCLVSINPPDGERKIGSIGLPFPYCDTRIFDCTPDGTVKRECGTNETGEICTYNPGVVVGNTYKEVDKNVGLFADTKYLRTGDLGYMDEDGYLWITGRAKDIIIRGGHNIDPATIEEALAGHKAVALSGAIGQPDKHSGELPCVYVELVSDSEVSENELLEYMKEHIGEKAAVPKYVEIVDELPKTAVGKILKNELRKFATERVYNEALETAGLDAKVKEVYEHKKRGLVAIVALNDKSLTEDALSSVLGGFATKWEIEEA